MVTSFIAKLFGSLTSGSAEEPEEKQAEVAAPRESAAAPQVPADIPAEGDPVAFVDYVVKQLVETPQEVQIETQNDNRGTLIRIHCRKDEVGRVVGKQGKTIDAIRSLVKASAARTDQRMSVVIVED